ncbi:MAG: 2-phospho-L-lactate guanylyltransferase [Alphaproteobacteria bacterium]|nr:2-phospho-L-lactate guanylyltransferase [Alphaproteobacteria bacterium]
MKALLLPVKLRDDAKQRLAPLLPPEDRRTLMSAMIVDGFAAARAARAPARVYVVTADPGIATMAEEFGFRVLREEIQISESASVDEASSRCAAEGVTALLRLPLDLPMVTGADIDAVFAAEADVVIVPSRDGTGTNAILRRPPTLFPSHFGPDSLPKHRAEAARAGATVVLLEIARIAMDVDDAADLRALLAHAPAGATGAWLAARPDVVRRLRLPAMPPGPETAA